MKLGIYSWLKGILLLLYLAVNFFFTLNTYQFRLAILSFAIISLIINYFQSRFEKKESFVIQIRKNLYRTFKIPLVILLLVLMFFLMDKHAATVINIIFPIFILFFLILTYLEVKHEKKEGRKINHLNWLAVILGFAIVIYFLYFRYR